MKKIKSIAYTVTNYAYLHKAIALKKSFQKNNNLRLRIFLFEEKNNIPNNIYSNEYEFLSDLKIHNYYQLAFKYNVTEFTTSLKPTISLKLLEKYDKVLFFDPDTFIYNSVNQILKKLDKYSIVLTPHSIHHEDHNSIYPDSSFLKYGVFNLGFFGVNASKDSINFLKWWEKRCLNQCYFEVHNGLSTDQKWINIAHAFFDNIFIDKSPSLNVAYWNIKRRKFSQKDTSIYVGNTKLVFIHYSNFPDKIENFLSTRSNLKFSDIDNGKLIKSLYLNYGRMTVKIKEKISLKNYIYSYEKFNGYYITMLLRRIYGENQSQFENNPFKSKKLFQFAKKNSLLSNNSLPVNYNENNVNRKKLNIVKNIFKIIIKIYGARNFTNLSRLMIYLSSPHRIKNFYKINNSKN